MAKKPTYKELENRIKETEQEVLELKQEKVALTENEQRYRNLFESAPLGYQALDAKGVILECNETWCRAFGHIKEEVLGRNILEFIHPDFKNVFKQNFSKLKNLGYILGVVFEMVKKDGTKIVVSFDGRMGLEKNGSFREACCVFRDITDCKHSEISLKNEESCLEDYINSLPGLFYVFDEERFVRWNNQWEIVTGYTAKEIGERYGPDFFLDSDRILIADRMKAVFVEGAAGAEAELVTKEGRRIPYYFTGLRKKFNGRDHLVGLGIDISDRKRAEKEKEKLEEQFRQVYKMRALGTLAGGIAHDFNNSLAAILGFAELSLYQNQEDDFLQYNLEQIVIAVNHSKDLVKQILTFARPTIQEPKPIDLKLIIADTHKLLKATLSATIELRQNLQVKSSMISADSNQIQQILMNLCSNAAYAMREKHGLLEINLVEVDLLHKDIVALPELKPGPYLRLTIRDNGLGIDQKNLDRIFDPFFTTKGPGEGTGMGLSVVHGIVTNHDGAVRVNSSPGRGTTFQIFLPKVEVARPAVTEISKPVASKTAHGACVLFVDDEKALVVAGKKILEHLGYKVIACTSSLEALKAFRKQPDEIDIVISDMAMPNMTGMDLSRAIMDIRPNIPVIVCTGFSEQINPEKAKEKGIREMLMKPLSMNDLSETISKVLSL